MNNVQEIKRITEIELKAQTKVEHSWHADWKDTAWVFVGNLDNRLSEGDVLAVISQVGEVEDLHLVREIDSGKSKGFCFVKFEDWRSTVLAVDNFNGVNLLGRTLRVDHARYERPKKKKDIEAGLSEADLEELHRPGHAYQDASKIEIQGEHDLFQGVDHFKRPKKTLIKDKSASKVEKRSKKKAEKRKSKKNSKKRKKKKSKKNSENKSSSSKRARPESDGTDSDQAWKGRMQPLPKKNKV